jgi:hypothetical protein
MSDLLQAPPGSGPALADDAWSRLEATYRGSVGEDQGVVVLAIDLLDLDRLAATCEVAPDVLLGAVEAALAELSGSCRVVVARRGARLVALAPAVTFDRGEGLAADLVAACRKLEIDGRSHRAVPVVGLARLPDKGDFHLETLVRVAEEGVRIAGFRGPGATAHSQIYGSMDARVRREIDEEGATFSSPPARGAGTVVVPRAAPPVEDEPPGRDDEGSMDARPPQPTLEARVREIASRTLADPAGRAPSNGKPGTAPRDTRDTGAADAPRRGDRGADDRVAAVTERVLAALRAEPGAHRATVVPPPGTSEEDEDVDLLRRRVAKLVDRLEKTEQRLAAVEHGREILGIPSAFRSVQGLTGNEPDFERKIGLMRQILEANLALQDAIAARAQPPVPSPDALDRRDA